MIDDGPTLVPAPGGSSRFEFAARSWQVAVEQERQATSALVERWEASAATLAKEEAALTAGGRWRGGPRTLMAALRLQYRELPLTAGLAWLLRPDGHHGLGTLALDALLRHLGLPACEAPNRVRVALEDHREDTRADLVVYGSDFTIVVEAKIFALEQPRQLERLESLWEHDPGATFIFLTRGERPPTTARAGGAQWHALTWTDVASIVQRATDVSTGAAPGVEEFRATLEEYHHD